MLANIGHTRRVTRYTETNFVFLHLYTAAEQCQYVLR